MFTPHVRIHSRGEIYYCIAVLTSNNLILFDIHEKAHFIGVMLKVTLYYSDVNVLGVSKVGIRFYIFIYIINTHFIAPLPLSSVSRHICYLWTVFKMAK